MVLLLGSCFLGFCEHTCVCVGGVVVATWRSWLTLFLYTFRERKHKKIEENRGKIECDSGSRGSSHAQISKQKKNMKFPYQVVCVGGRGARKREGSGAHFPIAVVSQPLESQVSRAQTVTRTSRSGRCSSHPLPLSREKKRKQKKTKEKKRKKEKEECDNGSRGSSPTRISNRKRNRESTSQLV